MGSYRANVGHPPSVRVKRTSLSFTGNEITLTLATTPQPQVGVPFPHIGLRQALSGMTDANVQTQLAMAARYHIMFVTGGRSSSWTNGGTTYTMANLPQGIKGKPDYNGAIPPAHCIVTKYNNFTQLNVDGNDFFIGKYQSEFTGSKQSWFVLEPQSGITPRPGAGPGGSGNTWATNFSSFPTRDHNNIRMNDWHTRCWFADPTDPKAGFNTSNYGTGNDWVAPTGRGLRSGAWDGIFCDDQSMVTGKADQTSGADWDGDGTGENDTDTDMLRARVNGTIEAYSAWRQRFTEQSLGTMRYAIGNITAIANSSTAAGSDTWPQAMGGEGFTTTGIVGSMQYDGGLIEETSSRLRTQGFGTHGTTTTDVLGNTIHHTGAMGLVWRAEDYCTDAQLILVGHDLDDFTTNQQDFREIFSPGKPNSAIRVGGSLVEVSTFSDWRLNRAFMAMVTVYSNGYITINQHTNVLRGGSKWSTDFPWYDEFVGGTARAGTTANRTGWLGNPVDAKQTGPRSGANGCAWRMFQNGIVVCNPFRKNQNTDFTTTITLPSLGANRRYRRLTASPNGYTTDTASGVQDATVNNGALLTNNQVTLQEFDGIFLLIETF
jgi:hypothetical protein